MDTVLSSLNKIDSSKQFLIQDSKKENLKKIVEKAKHKAAMLAKIESKYVVVSAKSNIQTIELILTIWFSGKCYVPINESSSEARKKYIKSNLSSMIQVSLDMNDDLIVNGNSYNTNKVNDLPVVSPDDSAYVIFTSGTTGNPKGVEISHNNLFNTLNALREHFETTKQKTWINLHSFEFDFSIWEIFASLLYGDNLVLLGDSIEPFEFDKITALIDKNNVNVINQTPSVFLKMIPYLEHYKFSNISTVIFGGEKLDYSTIASVFKKHQDTISMFNLYGITEVTIHATYHEIVEDDFKKNGWSNIGRGLFGDNVFLIDKNGNPTNDIGEIVVTGDTVACGYINNSEEDKKHFYKGHTIYHSGDFGQYDTNGNINYLYRIDSQVEISGHRIELSNVESTIENQLPVNVAKCISYSDRLFCFYVGEEVNNDEDGWKAILSKYIEPYMIPQNFFKMTELPTNSNGKVDDQKLLSNLSQKLIIDKTDSSNGDNFEEWLVDYVRNKKGTKKFNDNLSFMQLGLSSLDLISLANDIATKFVVKPSMTIVDLFQFPSIKEFNKNFSIVKR